MEFTWQIWPKLLFGICIAGSTLVLCILFIYFLVRCTKWQKNNTKKLDEVIIVREKEQLSDKDENGNHITKANLINETGSKSNEARNLEDQNTKRSLSSSSSFLNIERRIEQNWYHSCPEFGRSTITHSENGYIIIAQTRPIVVDGSSVAFAHGKQTFSAKGLQIVYKYFIDRGWTNKEITIFAKPVLNLSDVDQNICRDLEKMGILHWTFTNNPRPVAVTSEEDYKILEYAKRNGGIIVTKNQYHGWHDYCPEFRKVIEKRLLRYTFVNDELLFHTGSINRAGKTLEEFLTF